MNPLQCAVCALLALTVVGVVAAIVVVVVRWWRRRPWLGEAWDEPQDTGAAPAPSWAILARW